MTRQQILQYVKEKYGTVSQHLWLKYPDYEVLRHEGEGKWYGIIMDVPRKKIGLEGDGTIDILVLKGKPDDIIHICDMKGFAPAYHMNKKHWFTAVLSEAEDSAVWGMIDKSYELTK